jgi:FixJ family two-component response regulator
VIRADARAIAGKSDSFGRGAVSMMDTVQVARGGSKMTINPGANREPAVEQAAGHPEEILQGAIRFPVIAASDDEEVSNGLTRILRGLQCLDIHVIGSAKLNAVSVIDPNFTSLILLDITNDSISLASSKLSFLRGVKQHDLIIFLGRNQTASTVAIWFRQGIFDYLDWQTDQAVARLAFSRALQRAEYQRQLEEEFQSLHQQKVSITEGESQVLDLIMQGLTNQAISRRLGISLRTVESRRQKIHKKMQTPHLVELIRSVQRAEWLSDLLDNR